MKKILVIDNYDSFTYNLVHLLRRHTSEITVLKNDEISIDDVEQFDKLLFSPGPGIPIEAGNMCLLIKTFAGKKPMLGVCLGHQAIGEVFGGTLENLSKVYHGVATKIELIGKDYLFDNVPQQFSVGRYHSWVISENKFPGELVATAIDGTGMIMAIAHRQYDIKGVQFHPESIMTEHGETIIANWIKHE